jgi:hypothetical protein
MKNAAVLCVILLLLACIANAGTITMVSGNTSIGQRDPVVSIRGGDVSINSATYQMAAIDLQQALVISKNHDWATLPGSNWVGVADGESGSPDGGYYYQCPFQMPSIFTNASITLTMTCDNFGQVYLNGWLLGTVAQEPPSTFTRLFTFSSSDPAFFASGMNMLQFRVANAPIGPDLTNPSGLIFKADISYVPEPANMLGMFTGLTGIVGLFRRKNK